MGANDATSVVSGLTERQRKWFASVRSGLEAKTGKNLEQWVAIARGCPADKPRARLQWLKESHGLGQNHAMFVLGHAFTPTTLGWDDPQALRDALWSDPAACAILERVESAVAPFPELVTGQRKQFTSFSRKVQFAALKPVKGGQAELGLAVAAGFSPRLAAAGKEAWSERLKAKVRLASPEDVDEDVRAWLRLAWEAA